MSIKVLTAVFSPLIWALTGLLCFTAVPVKAAEDCDSPQTQIEINLCAVKTYEQADKELNETYKEALEKLKKDDPAKIERFKDVQRAWVKFRDLNCEYQSDLYEGGSMAPGVHSDCMTELTQVRTHQIPFLFDDWPKN